MILIKNLISITFFAMAIAGNSAICINIKTQNIPSDTSIVIHLMDSAETLITVNPEASKAILMKAIKMSDEINFYSGKAQILNTLGILTYQKGIVDSAKYYFDLSLKQWELLNNKKQVSNLYNNISIILAGQNEIAKAIEYNKKSLELKIKFNDTIPIANGYNNLGTLYQDLGNIKEALYLQHKSLKLRTAVKDSARLSHSYVNLGDIYNLTGDLDSAYYYGQKALVLQMINNDNWGIANSYGVLAEFHYLKDELDSAIIYVDRSLNIAEKIGFIHLIEEMNVLKSVVLLKQQKISEALKTISKQKDYYNAELGISSLKTLAQIYQKKGDNKKASFYYKKYNAKNDSLQETNQKNRISEISANHFYELQELELKNKKELEENRLQQIISQEQEENSRLWLITGLFALIAILLVLAYSSIKRKNKTLNKQRKEIDALVVMQKEVIEARTTELLSNQDAISKYTFLNSHELKDPLSKILKTINSSKKEEVENESFFQTLKEGAEELEGAVRKISKALHKGRKI